MYSIEETATNMKIGGVVGTFVGTGMLVGGMDIVFYASFNWIMQIVFMLDFLL